MCRGKVSKTPLKGTRFSFWGRGFEFFLTPQRYQFLNKLINCQWHDCFQAKNSEIKFICVTNTRYSVCYLYRSVTFKTLKGTATTLLVVILGFSILSGTNSKRLPPKGTTSTPVICTAKYRPRRDSD